MKITLTTLAIILCSFLTKAQGLSANDLFYIIKHDISDNNEYLINKGWEYHNVKKTDTILTSITWSYNLNRDENKASGWLKFRTELFEGSELKDVTYEFGSQTDFKNFLTYLRSIKAQKLKPKIEDESIVDTYKGEDYAYVITTHSSNTQNQKYSFKIMGMNRFELELWIETLSEKKF